MIRAARSSDLDAIEGLVARCALPVAGLADQFPAAYVVAVDGAPVGVAGLEVYGSHGLLRSVAVDPAARGRGLGRQLVADRLAQAHLLGLGAVYLLTNTAADYFARLGFVSAPREGVPPAVRASAEFSTVCPRSACCFVWRGERDAPP